MRTETVVLLGAIAGITAMVMMALMQGIDGKVLTVAVGAIALIAGVKLRDLMHK